MDIDKVKIQKKLYRFDIKRRYQYENHYRVIERSPLEQIRDELNKLFASKEKEKKAKKKEAPLAAPSKPPGGFNFAVLGAALLIALIVLGIAWIYLTVQLAPPPEEFKPAADKPELMNTIVSGEVLNSGQRGSLNHRAAVFVEYNTSNLDNYTIILTPYEQKIPSEVFVLNSEKIEASIYPDFMRELRHRLGSRNVMLNEISIKQLETIPEGAIVIVPSGVVPKELLGYDSRISMNKLANRGVVVIYIGQPFTQMLNGTLAVSTPKEKLNELPVTFDETTPLQSEQNFSLFQPLYRAGSKGTWVSRIAYGSVSVVRRNNGAFVFVPQTLDGGWRNDYELAANDISRIVFEIPWANSLASNTTYQFVNQSSYVGERYFFTEGFEPKRTSVRVDFIGESSASKYPVRETLYIYLEKETNSNLYIQEGVNVIPTNLTNNPVRLNAEMKEPEPGQPNMFLLLVDENGSQVETYPQGNVNVQADRSFDVGIFGKEGEYIMQLIDDQSRVYAQTYLNVVSIDVSYRGLDSRRRSTYVFSIAMDNQPVTIDTISLEIDDGRYGTYEFNDVSTIRVDLERYTGSTNQRLPDGVHTFEFVSSGLRETVTVKHESPPSIFTDPLFWVTVILTAVIVGFGVYFARQEEIFYSLDIPDFPPVARTKIPLSQDVVLSLFSKVNENYHWEFTPLTTSEIKSAFKGVFYKGRPIFITDYNVEFLLEQLEKKELVSEAMEYYGLAEWEEKTKHSIDYLAIMRKLRDICVNNAVPFTGLGESKKADSVITVVGQQMFLHFFEGEKRVKELLEGVLNTIGKGITIIVFKDIGEKEKFRELVDSSPTVAPLILKMEAESKSLLLYTADELEDMIKEFKSM
ncbi:hypothetical protein GF318_06220 [Candidatus Micrarchaeota archaeon]|nr:hypothetical protein [Candidatus Micrarchaeota archaeon]